MITLDMLDIFSRGQEQNCRDLQDIHQASPKRVRVKCSQGSKWQWFRVSEYSSWGAMQRNRNQAWILFNLYTSTKWGCGEEEQDLNHPCKSNARWLWDFAKVLGGSYQHRLPCGKSGISPKVLEEDPIWTSCWEEAQHLLLSSFLVPMLHLQEEEAPR